LKLPEWHRRRGRTVTTLERLIEEARRRITVIGPRPREQWGASLIHAVPVEVSKRWGGIRLAPHRSMSGAEDRWTTTPLPNGLVVRAARKKSQLSSAGKLAFKAPFNKCRSVAPYRRRSIPNARRPNSDNVAGSGITVYVPMSVAPEMLSSVSAGK
jgi:hypothetical protein